MKKIIYILTITSVALFSIYSCNSDEVDSTKPTIVINEPHDGELILIGGELALDFDLSDDVELYSYKINIHNAFDKHGHSHAPSISKIIAVETIDFEYDVIYDDAEGKKSHHGHLHIPIPEDATPGDYHLMIYCTDAARNEAYVAIEIELSHDGEEHEHEH